MTFVLAYGSLLLPDSLGSTVPAAPLGECLPAEVIGYRRDFGVAFPNDGSQSDKAYLAVDGSRPPVVRFANAYPVPGAALAGVCVPVDDAALGQLRGRELRYEVVDVTDAVEVRATGARPTRVLMFTGAPRFTDPDDVARGVVPEGYVEAIRQGADFWDVRAPGFRNRVERSTDWPLAGDVVPLRRVVPPDARNASAPPDAMVGPWRR